MADRHSTARIPAVVYLRRSSDRQEKSIDDQRTAVAKYADENGYTLVREYVDDAISGDDIERRLAFKEMHHEACNGRDFDAILVWDQDRFGRFDSVDAGEWVAPLRRAGVKLVTVNEGPIDWNDFTGRVMFSLKQEGKHQFLIDLSRNSTQGRISTAEQGYLCGQAAPYGFDRMVVDPATGKHLKRVQNGEDQTGRSKRFKVTLVESNDPETVVTVRFIFDTFANEDTGVRAIANELNRRGIPGPATGQLRKGKPVSGKWYAGSVRAILMNEAYVGTFVYAKRTHGKYNRVAGTNVKRRDSDDFHRTKIKVNAGMIRVEDAFPALVDRATWDRAQRKLANKKRQRTRRGRKDSTRYMLTGLVHCGCCGGVMHGTRNTKKKGGKTYEWERYVCSTYHKFGNRDRNEDGTGCYSNTIDQAGMLDFLLRKLRDVVLADGNREALLERVREKLTARQSKASDVSGLRKRLGELDRDIDRATDRLLTAPDDLMDVLAPKVQAMRAEQARLTSEVEQAVEASQRVDVEAEAQAAVAKLETLSDELRTAKPARLRELVHRMVQRIDLWYRQAKMATGKRTRSTLARGRIVLNASTELSSAVAYVGTRGFEPPTS